MKEDPNFKAAMGFQCGLDGLDTKVRYFRLQADKVKYTLSVPHGEKQLAILLVGALLVYLAQSLLSSLQFGCRLKLYTTSCVASMPISAVDP